jgi:hypothetical protein
VPLVLGYPSVEAIRSLLGVLCLQDEQARMETYPNLLEPYRMKAMMGVKVKFVAAGSAAAHILCIDMEGRLHTWGRNSVRDPPSRGPVINWLTGEWAVLITVPSSVVTLCRAAVSIWALGRQRTLPNHLHQPAGSDNCPAVLPVSGNKLVRQRAWTHDIRLCRVLRAIANGLADQGSLCLTSVCAQPSMTAVQPCCPQQVPRALRNSTSG